MRDAIETIIIVVMLSLAAAIFVGGFDARRLHALMCENPNERWRFSVI